eukprot:CAMPEP_0171069446 /NCGR_PEP_ID=MMETSP0766_2-20121228/9154_1 /TAXON_ID=439317 /ORGANISM="Gambierdiscus australes, Strain CAWD 149" /LENGTH=35 /DNA_ID= /DNA_START= /DNA_END= /DNA_ORIENTATION=
MAVPMPGVEVALVEKPPAWVTDEHGNGRCSSSAAP